MSFRVELRPAAERDLQRLADFVAQMDERAGVKRARALREAVRKLGRLPLAGRPGPRPGLRERTLKFGKSSYLVRYRVTENAVVVIRIWHGKENRPR